MLLDIVTIPSTIISIDSAFLLFSLHLVVQLFELLYLLLIFIKHSLLLVHYQARQFSHLYHQQAVAIFQQLLLFLYLAHLFFILLQSRTLLSDLVS